MTANTVGSVRVLSSSLGSAQLDVRGGDGVRLHLADGRRVIDASNTAAPLGHHHPALAAALRSAEFVPALNEGWSWPQRDQAARDLVERVFRVDTSWVGAVRFFHSGSEANDQALSLAQVLTGRLPLVARTRGYHGLVGLARDVTVQPHWHGGISSLHGGWSGAPKTTEIRQIPAPRCGLRKSCSPDDGCQCLRGAEDLLAGAAAVIVDYSQGGIYPAPGYQDTLASQAKTAGALWIADEVVTGLGRQGRWLTLERGNARPDMITLGKGLAGGVAPAAALVLSRDLAEALDDASWRSYSTFRGHPLTVAAVSATLRAIDEEDLVSRVDELDPTIRTRFSEVAASHPSVRRVDGLGFHWTIELHGGDWTRWHADTAEASIADTVTARALEEDVLFATSGEEDSIFVAPPLISTSDDLEEVFAALDAGLAAADALIHGNK